MSVRRSRPEQTTKWSKPAFLSYHPRDEGEQSLSFPSGFYALATKSIVLVGLKARLDWRSRGAAKTQCLLYFNENRLAAIGW